MPEAMIETLDDPRLTFYRNLKRSNPTRWSGAFIAEGEKVVRRLLASEYRVHSVLVSDAHRDKLPAGVADSVEVLILPHDLAQQLVEYRFHAGILACGQRQTTKCLDEFAPAERSGSSLLVACDRITDPDNLGTLSRLCTAFGVDGMVLGPGCADPFSRRALRVSMGNTFSLPMLESGDLRRDLRSLRDRGYRLLAATLHPSARPLPQTPLSGRMVLLLGNEAHGLEESWLRETDDAVVIPMRGETDSLNVGVAAGIILHYVTQLASRGAQ